MASAVKALNVKAVLKAIIPFFAGAVQLPNTYGSHFRTTDKNNNSIDDDLAKFYRHIHPVPTRPGYYYLSPLPKDKLERDAPDVV